MDEKKRERKRAITIDRELAKKLEEKCKSMKPKVTLTSYVEFILEQSLDYSD